MESHDVIIVGGGPTGLSAARRLADLGIRDVVVLEREAEAGGIPRHCGHLGFGWQSHRRLWSGPRLTVLGCPRRGRSGQISPAATVVVAALRLGATFAGLTLACGTLLALTAASTFLALTGSALTLTSPVTPAVPIAPGFTPRPALPLSTLDGGHDHCRRDNDCGKESSGAHILWSSNTVASLGKRICSESRCSL